jgi:chromosome segregation ATPase
MTNVDNSVGGATDVDGGAVNEVEPKNERGSEEWEKLLKQRKKTQSENAELKQRLAALEAAEKQREEDVLAQQAQYKELADRYKSQLEEVKQEKGQLESNFLDAHKLNAFRERLPGAIKKSEYYSFVNLDKIIVDPDSKQIVEDSVDELVNDFITQYPDLYTARDSKKLPSDAATPDRPKSYQDELRAAKNQKELDAVLRKYGRA